MKRAVALLCVLCPAVASADVFKLFGEIHGGGMDGAGLSGTQKDSAFFANAPHAMYGALVGAELLFVDAWIQHHQYVDGSTLETWTQFGLGAHGTFDLGTEADQKQHKGGYFEIGGGLFFGLSTDRQVHPPLDNSQVSDKGFLVEGRLGFGTHLNKIFDLGVEVPVSYGFFFINGQAANSTDNQYRGWEAEALLALRMNLRLL
jgi:hypothetical protein